MLDTHFPRQNRLLAALPATEYARLCPHLEVVRLPVGEILHESGCQLRHIYFPTTAIVSLRYVMGDGMSAEITGIGKEGMIGIAVFTGGMTMPNQAMVLIGGHAYRMPAQVLINELHRSGGHTGALQHVLLRYTQARMTQIAQNAACNRHHSMENRLCRWLLSCLDRSASNELSVTQEAIASALGVRREGVTEAAGKLQRAGLISYHRGHITVPDRAGLDKYACECYQAVKQEFDRLLPDVTRTQVAAPVAYRDIQKASSPNGRRIAAARATP